MAKEECSNGSTFCGSCTIYIIVFYFAAELIWQNGITSLDPEKDFTPVSANCSITGVIYEGSCQLKCGDDGTKCGCKDKYSYNFAYTGEYNVGYQLTSEIGETNRDAKDCDDGGEEAIAAPLFTIGESVTCYRPSTPGKAHRLYTCGNDDCIKIFDPQNDKDESFLSECGNDGETSFLGVVFFVLGYFIFWVSIIIIVCIVYYCNICCVNDENINQVTTSDCNSAPHTVCKESTQTHANVEMSNLEIGPQN